MMSIRPYLHTYLTYCLDLPLPVMAPAHHHLAGPVARFRSGVRAFRSQACGRDFVPVFESSGPGPVCAIPFLGLGSSGP
jgi:hypothetical protein